MSSYLDNLKWIVTSKKESEIQEQILNKNTNSDENYLMADSESDSESEYHKINSNYMPNTNDSLFYNLAKDNYEKTYKELLDKEQLVRKRVNSDTFEKIKQNYTEYINDDVQIIKEFALVMETFENINIKLKNFVFEIGNFESGIKKYIGEHDVNKLEINNKINQIDKKLDNTIGMINKIKFDSDKFIKKLINLENLIKTHDEHRNEILLRLDKFNKEHDEMKNNNLQVLNFFKDTHQYFMFSSLNLNSNYLKYIGISLGISSCLFFSYKLMNKN